MKNEIKYLYSDLDGTIVSWNPKTEFVYQNKSYKNFHEVSDATISAFYRLQQKGIKVGIVTGRDYCRVLWLEKQLRTGLPTITLDGAIIFYQNEILSQTYLDDRFIEGINNIVKRFPEAAYKLNSGWISYFTKNPSVIFEIDYAFLGYFNPNTKLQKKFIDSTENWDLNKLKVNQVYFDIDTCPLAMQKEIIELISVSDVNAKIYEHSMYIIKNGVSKASALQSLNQFAIPITKDNTIVCGDGDNDIEIMQWAKHSVSLIGSNPKCFALAKYHTDSVDNDGIANWIEKNLLC
ncbi:Cof-like hydrolase [Mycoplasmoides genitalium M6320]|uniref:Cof-like hydrolase n=1 Tax=Mycoplasmoides genitalium M6320 TaxID=662945 RepID=A0ABC7ZIZ0_MYCGT|nr:Cof-type HAD-IIB family hydrolase [Mycoplasmoides genitalium]AFQ04088.1 Cof-like hydrolase [Mycoplasmoides genitalium M6320]